MNMDPASTCDRQGCPHKAVKGGRCADHATDTPPVDMLPLGIDTMAAMGEVPPMADRLRWTAVIVAFTDADGAPWTNVYARHHGPVKHPSYPEIAGHLAEVSDAAAHLDEGPPVNVWIKSFDHEADQ